MVRRAYVTSGQEDNRSQLVYKSGTLYGVFQPGTALFPVSAQTFKGSAPVAQGVSGLVRGTDGNLYYAKVNLPIHTELIGRRRRAIGDRPTARIGPVGRLCPNLSADSARTGRAGTPPA